MWHGERVSETGQLALHGKTITVLLAGIGNADDYLSEGAMGEGGVTINDFKEEWHHGAEFVKKVSLRLDKLVHARKSTFNGIAQLAIQQAFATSDSPKTIPAVRVCVASEAQQQGWYALNTAVDIQVVEEEVAL